ncbi:MAG: HPr-rel-A system PqqD family peptide chaperone [Vicinamibacterales bacterium]
MTTGNTWWRLAASGPLPSRAWDGDVVVYNRLSGDTHIVDIVTGEVLLGIAAGNSRGDTLCRHIAAFLDIPDEESLRDRVGQILRTLDELGLIEPVNGC